LHLKNQDNIKLYTNLKTLKIYVAINLDIDLPSYTVTFLIGKLEKFIFIFDEEKCGCKSDQKLDGKITF